MDGLLLSLLPNIALQRTAIRAARLSSRELGLSVHRKALLVAYAVTLAVRVASLESPDHQIRDPLFSSFELHDRCRTA
jgi:hypothetical protein